MPGLSGIATLHLVRTKGAAVPIILMTGYAATAALDEEETRSGLLQKPFTLVELATKIDDALRSAGSAGIMPSSKVVPIRPAKRANPKG